MAFKVQAKITGVKELTATLSGLARAVRNKILRKMMGEAGKVVLKRAKQLVPRETGLLKKSLGRKVKLYRNSGVGVAVVGPRTGPKFRQTVTRTKGRWFPRTAISSPTKYAHLVEGGTGHSPARPFLAPAVGQHQTILEAMGKAMAAGLEAAAKKGG